MAEVSAVVISVIFMILGIMMCFGKLSFLIAGFNTMSKEEKEKYDEKSLCRFMGKVTIVIGVCVFLLALSHIINIKGLFTLGMILFWITIIFTVIYCNTGNRFINK